MGLGFSHELATGEHQLTRLRTEGGSASAGGLAFADPLGTPAISLGLLHEDGNPCAGVNGGERASGELHGDVVARVKGEDPRSGPLAAFDRLAG